MATFIVRFGYEHRKMEDVPRMSNWELNSDYVFINSFMIYEMFMYAIGKVYGLAGAS